MRIKTKITGTLLIVVFSYLLPAFATAATLPRVTGITLTGSELSWDTLDEATGYNIYLDRGYYDTVKGSNSYTVTEAGSYQLVAFNDEGEFGLLRYPDETFQGGEVESVDFDGVDSENSVSYDYNFGRSLIVATTCQNVGPGESCIAQCPSSYEAEFAGTLFTDYISGGACSTSDIVEADAFISQSNYKCTVPTFSGEVVAQAVCVLF